MAIELALLNLGERLLERIAIVAGADQLDFSREPLDVHVEGVDRLGPRNDFEKLGLRRGFGRRE